MSIASAFQIDIAAHSRMLEPILQEFGDYLRSIDAECAANPLHLEPFSGQLITEARGNKIPTIGLSTSTRHGAFCRLHRHARRTTPNRIFIEVGPGKALSSLSSQHDPDVEANQVISSPCDTRLMTPPMMPISWRCWVVSGPWAAIFDWDPNLGRGAAR